jgi:multiple sugar transport system ATP-binding protein
MARIELKQVAKSYGSHQVIPGVDLTVEDGEFMVFVGPSGCGKSTMLRMLAGLEATSGGELLFDGQRVNEVAAAERGVAMVFQNYALYPHMTVAENMGFSLRMSGKGRAERDAMVAQTADKLQLTELLERYPKQLSGGQRQRVAIGRAIVRRPRVFLFDEPLSNLDAALRVQMRIELARLHADLGTTMVYVTHDQTEAMTLGSRIAVFNKGRIEQVGRPMDLYNAPANTFVAQFLGTPKINLMAYAVDATASAAVLDQTVKLSWSELGLPPSVVELGCTLGVRPENLHIEEAGSGLRGVVEFTERLGDSTNVYLRLLNGKEPLIAKLSHADRTWQVGEVVGLRLEPGRILMFDASGQSLGRP